MRLLVRQLRAEQLLFWRSREAAFFTFFLPIILYVLLASAYGDEVVEGQRGAAFLLAGLLGYGAVATAFAGLAVTLVIRRETGVLKRLRATPLPPWKYISAVLASTLVVFAIEAALLLALGGALFDVGMPDRPGSLVLALALGTASFAALGLAITAVVRSAEGSSAVVNAIFLPAAFVSGSFFSTESMPGFLRAVAEVLPLPYLIELVRAAFHGGEAIWERPGDVAVVAAWGAVGIVAAARGFRWEPREG